jgi:LPXTG-motif cell wall-anchored protein
MRKIIILFLSLWLIIGFQNSKVFALGSGTLLDPWQIFTVDDLKAIGTVGDWDDAYVLMNDLDISLEDWTALGTSGAHLFSGVFDGDNHTITGLTINLIDTTSNVVSTGLFYGFGAATIRKLNLTDVDIQVSVTDSDLYVGALVGFAQLADGEKLLIDQTSISGNMNVTYHYDTFESHHRFVGGMVGEVIGDNNPLFASMISNNFMMMDVNFTVDQNISGWYQYEGECAIGGFVGKADDLLFQSNVLDQSNLGFSTDLPHDEWTEFYLGGIVGLYSTETDFATSDMNVFLDNTVRSSVIDGIGHVGGFVGSYVSSIDNKVREAALNDVIIKGYYRVGGIMGVGEHLSLENVRIKTLSMTIYAENNTYYGGIVAYGTNLNFKGIVSIDGFIFRKSDVEHYIGTVGSLAGILEECVSDAFITVKNIDIIAGNNVGGLIGSAYNVTLNQATVSDAQLSGDNQVGGIIGGSANGTLSLSNVSFEGTLQGNGRVGGIVGYTDTKTIIDHAMVLGDITINGYYAGGIVGKSISNWDDDDTLTITDSYARPTIYYTANAYGIGGIIGCGTFTINQNSNPIHLTDVYYAGELIFVPDDEHETFEHSSTLSPILGWDASPNFNHLFSHVYYDSTLYTGSNTTGVGTAKTTVELMQKTGYVGFDFTGLDNWFITSGLNDGYATFNPGLIRIDFLDTDGTLLEVLIIDPNSPVSPIEDPKRTGYVFDKWLDEDDNPFDFNTLLNSSLILKSSYKEELPDTGSHDSSILLLLGLSLGFGLISRKKKHIKI